MTDEINEFDEATVILQIQQFLDEWHYRVIATLAGSWDRPQATVAALSLLELQGVPFGPGEKESLAKLEESAMIPKVLAKMPQEFKHSFEHFALQLQLIVTTATRVRKTVDEGSPDNIQLVMDHTDSSGIISQILKQSIVQAGIEVAEIRNRHTSWVKNTETRMSRLVRSADDAADAQRQLQALQVQLNGFGSTQNEKSKRMMANVGANNDKMLVAMVFGSWFSFTAKMKSEKDIRDMFEAEIENLDQKLMDYRTAALNNVRNVLMRKAAEGDAGLMKQVWKSWTDEVAETKREAGSQGAMAAMEAKLAAQSQAQMENSKKVMARMSSGSDSALLTIVIGSWAQWLADYKKNKDMEDAVKAQEKAMEEYMKKKKDEAKGVLDRMNSSTDSGLQEHIMSTWCQYFKDTMEAMKMERIMAENEARFASLNGRQKDNAKGVQQRINEQMDLNLMLKHFAAWATDTKLERIMRHYNSKMEGKKAQLQSVQHLFKNFAHQLDQGLKADADSSRDSSRRKRDDGSVTLPEIQKK
jgi:hypothetical protein